jgi:hypothetical protein
MPSGTWLNRFRSGVTEMSEVKKAIGSIFYQLADALETGTYEEKIRVGLTTLASEHGDAELIQAALTANRRYPDIEIILIGSDNNSGLKTLNAGSLSEAHSVMEKALDDGTIHAAVTLHYNFPIGVSTVGRVTTPGRGREMFLATTTGTTSTQRVEAMIKNTICGIAVAKASGIEKPSVGILNVECAPQVENRLKALKDNGYHINFASTIRAGGGCIMRGNDLLAGSPDIMVTDTLTGNLLVKVFSAYSTGGDYEAIGFGYGPGVGENYNRIINIISRASGAPLIANAIKFAADMAKNGLPRIFAEELERAKKAGLEKAQMSKETELTPQENKVTPPEKKIVTEEIGGIDILEIENAVRVLWAAGIYAESGMGCTGPVVMVAESDHVSAWQLLKSKSFLG